MAGLLRRRNRQPPNIVLRHLGLDWTVDKIVFRGTDFTDMTHTITPGMSIPGFFRILENLPIDPNDIPPPHNHGRIVVAADKESSCDDDADDGNKESPCGDDADDGNKESPCGDDAWFYITQRLLYAEKNGYAVLCLDSAVYIRHPNHILEYHPTVDFLRNFGGISYLAIIDLGDNFVPIFSDGYEANIGIEGVSARGCIVTGNIDDRLGVTMGRLGIYAVVQPGHTYDPYRDERIEVNCTVFISYVDGRYWILDCDPWKPIYENQDGSISYSPQTEKRMYFFHDDDD